MKVELQTPKAYRNGRNHWAFNEHVGTITLKRSLPFYQSRAGTYIHRIRNAQVHYFDDVYRHTSFSFWCGGTGSEKKGKILSEVPHGEIVCATCEGRAIGAGQTDSHKINGQMVKFSPRI